MWQSHPVHLYYFFQIVNPIAGMINQAPTKIFNNAVIPSGAFPREDLIHFFPLRIKVRGKTSINLYSDKESDNSCISSLVFS
jgi:hypothetical protein